MQLQPRQVLGGGASPLQPSLAQLLQSQYSPVFPGNHQALNTLGLGLESQGLPFSSLQNTLGGQSLASSLHALGNQGLYGSPFMGLGAGLGGTQLLGNPGLLRMLPGVNRLGMLGATNQLGGGQLGIHPGALGLGLHPLLSQSQQSQAPAGRHNNLGQLLRLASLLSDEPEIRHNTHAAPKTRFQLTGSFNHRPTHHHPVHPLHRLLSLPTNTHERHDAARVILDGRNPAAFTNRDDLSNSVSKSGSPQPTEFSRPSHRLPHASHLPLTSGTHRPTTLDGFRFPSK